MAINKKELILRVSKHTNNDTEIVEDIIETTLTEIYKSLKAGESVSLINFGTFYIKTKSSGTVFKFNPSQKLRKLFGWSSTYNGEL
jgi:DNA-binding protein HU-beta